uniref:Uncharacterized protein n=1 Tax=Anguilla anguilla TaxID=7936 RepID=A0A0E9VMF1_ANGAN
MQAEGSDLFRKNETSASGLELGWVPSTFKSKSGGPVLPAQSGLTGSAT